MQFIELLLMFVSVLLAVAFLTVAERKTLGYMQRRVGPNAVGLNIQDNLLNYYNYYKILTKL